MQMAPIFIDDRLGRVLSLHLAGIATAHHEQGKASIVIDLDGGANELGHVSNDAFCVADGGSIGNRRSRSTGLGSADWNACGH
jgi:hypothetical protein